MKNFSLRAMPDVSLRGFQSSLLVGALFLAFMASAHADQESTNYGIPFDVNNAGGADVSKSNVYLLSDSLGEPIVGYGSTDNYILNSGYRQPSASDFISISCTDFVNLGSVVGTGQKSGSGTCTVYTDAYDGYRMVWQAGSNNKGGLVGHWKLDETSGTTAYDSSGNGNNGTLTNGPVISTDTPSKYFSTRSVSFDGVNDYIDLGSSSTLKPASQLTVSIWMYRPSWTGGSSEATVSCTHASGYEFYRNVGGGLMSFYVYRNGTYGITSISLASLASGWHHFTGTYDGRYTKLYVDGSMVSTDDAGGIFPITYISNNIFIGAEGSTNATPEAGFYANSKQDDVRIYNTALSDDEIRDLASLAPPGSLTASGSQTSYIPGIYFPSTGGLVGHWKLEETIAGTVADSSGYNNDGTPTGAAGANNTPQPSTSVPGSTTFLTTRSMDFDGTDDYVNVSNSFSGSTVNIGSFSMWVKLPTTQTNINAKILVVGKQSDADLVEVGVNGAGGVVQLFTYSNGVVRGVADSTTSINDNRWHHVVGTWDGGGATIYIDGVSEDLDTTNSIMTFGTSVRLGIGAYVYPVTPTHYFLGSIDDVRIYNRVLSLAEIKALYGEPQAWSVAASDSAWGARLSSDSTDDDSKWGTDGGSEKWINLGDGTYTVVRRQTATPLLGSVQYMDFRGEVGSSKVQVAGVYRGVVTFTVVGY